MTARTRPRFLLAALTLATTLAALSGLGADALAAGKGAEITLNLKDAEISTLIATVSEVTGKNFIVDPRVKGKVTVISSSPMDAAGVYETFLAVLQVQGFVAVPAGDAIKVIPEANARTEGGTHISGGGGEPLDEFVTHVSTLQNISANLIVAMLRPLVSQSGHLAAYAPNNTLIISDRAGNVARIDRLIAQMDQTSDRDLDVIKLENASAADVVRILTTLAQQAKQADPNAQQAAVIADERSNSVLLGGDKTDRARLAEIVHRLDQPTGNSGDTQVIYLHYASAESLAPILSGYAQQVSRPSSSSSSGRSGSAAAPVPVSIPTSSGGSTGGSGADGVRVLSDKDTNSLVITAPPKAMQQIRSVIAQLDIRRSQVLLEAIVAEVSENKSSQLGLDVVAYDPNYIATAVINNQSTISAIQSAGQALGGLGSSSGTSSTTGAAIAAGASLLTQGVTGVFGTYNQNTGALFGLLVKALASDGNTNILSKPSLTTLDNEEAKFSVGQEVPFQTGSFSNTGTATNGAVNPFQTIDRKDVGLKLGITPQLNDGTLIKLKIDFENSNIASGTAGGSNLITNKRTLTNVVTVESGQILMLSGLVDNQTTDTVSKVPLLGDIPVLGALFKSRSVTRTKTNLMIFIHPVKLVKADDGDFYTKRRYDELRLDQINGVKGPLPLIGGSRPVLQPYDDYVKGANAPVPPRADAPVITPTIDGLPTPKTPVTDTPPADGVTKP
jgi:general secretion pathway protein D